MLQWIKYVMRLLKSWYLMTVLAKDDVKGAFGKVEKSHGTWPYYFR